MLTTTSRRVLTVAEAAGWTGPPQIMFVGVTTAGSAAHRAFGGWARLLGQPWVLRGLDLPASTPPAVYQRLVAAMAASPQVHGAVITAHKLRLYRACAGELAQRDWLTGLTHEVNTLVTGESIAGYARDALSLAHVLPGLVRASGARALPELHVVCLGAGGAATALLLALYLDTSSSPAAGGPATTRPPARPRGPASVTFADISAQALASLETVASRAGIEVAGLSFVPVEGPGGCDALLARLPSPALVINATGLGKDAPGSPVTGRARFPPGALAWDLNYRGALTFLRQAQAQRAPVMDGWDYFVAGWAGCLTALAGVPFTSSVLAGFGEAASPLRPPRLP